MKTSNLYYKELSQEELKKILIYDSDTGIFRWRFSNKKAVHAGDTAGHKNKKGYIAIKYQDKSYLANRLAWLYTYGYNPENFIDHINRNTSDNRIVNLREATNQCNQRNSYNPVDNTSGIKGIYLYKRLNKWASRIVNNGNTIDLGTHHSFTEAVCHRLAAEQCLNWSGCDSNSPAYRYVQGILNGSISPPIEKEFDLTRDKSKVYNNYPTNSSGIRGVSFSTRNSVWTASLRLKGKLIFLGQYKDISDAIFARFAGEQCVGLHLERNNPFGSYSPAKEYCMNILGK